MRRISRFLLIFLAMIVLAATLPVRAQSSAQPQVVVLQTVPYAEPTDQQLGLDIFFTLRRSDGTPIILDEAELADAGEIRLLSGTQSVSPVSIAPATGPIRIAFVIDASGTMVSSIASVREAAKKALEQAPPNALVAVYAFHKLESDQVLVPIQDYTQNHQLIIQALDAITPKRNNPTCLYNAAFAATAQLAQSAGPADRRAIILFTDGKDEDVTGKPCSQRTVANVISGAQEKNTPIYTIGLCSTAACTNLNVDVLSQIAEGTNTFPRHGQLAEMEGQFRMVMDQINSQWVARGRVGASKGVTNATLTIFRTNQQAPLACSLTFSAPRDFYAVPSFQLKARYVENQDGYELTISASNTQSLQGIVIEAWSENSVVAELPVALAALGAPVLFPATKLSVGQKYNFLLHATDTLSNPFTAATPIFKDDPTVLAQSGEQAAYRPLFSYAVETINADWKRNELVVKLTIHNATETSAPIFSGYVSASNSEVLRFARLVPDAEGQIHIPLGNEGAFRSAAESQKPLLLTVTPENKPATEPKEREFTPTKPPTDWLPWLIGTASLLGLTVVVWLVRRQGSQGRYKVRPGVPYDDPSATKRAPHAPPIVGDQVGAKAEATLPVRRQLLLTLKKAPDLAKQPQRDWQVRDELTIVGRSATNAIRIEDPGISNTHLQLAPNGNAAWVLTAFKSTNGTWICAPDPTGNYPEIAWKLLAPSQEHAVTTGMRVRLGQDTELEFRIV